MLDQKMDFSRDAVFPKIDELFVDKRDDQYLLLNPKGPKWCAGSAHFAVFAELLDGVHSLGDIHQEMQKAFSELSFADVSEIAETIENAGLFYEGKKLPYQSLTTVMFNIVKSCNLNCPFCYYESGPHIKLRDEGLMEAKAWIDLGRDVLDINPDAKFYVSGGEPMVRSDCIEILEGLRDIGAATITLMTNGTLFKEPNYQQLANVKGLKVQISIDSIVPEENALTRGPGSLERAIYAIESFKKVGVDVFVTSTLTQHNSGSAAQLKAACDALSVRVKFTPFFLAGERSKDNADDLGLTPEEVMDVFQIDKAPPPDLSKGSDPMSHFLEAVDGTPKHGCGVGHGTMMFNPDGTISPCNHLTGDEFRIGDVTKEPLEDVVARGKERFGMIHVDQTPKEGCSTCHVRYICGGGCKASAFHAFGRFDTPPPDCRFLKKMHVDALWRSVSA